MSKNSISKTIGDISNDFLEENGYELYNVEFVKEGKTKFLRVYIDHIWDGKKQPEGISTDDCEKVSKYLSGKLDELDPIQGNYYLEVSSPGMDRPLLKEQHYKRYEGHPIDISLYKIVEGQKKYSGTLESSDGDTVKIRTEEGKEITFDKDNIAKAKLKVVF